MTSVDFLEQSLLYRMSLGSKELYHSNVWAWLMENDANFVKVFFPGFDNHNWLVNDVRREWHNRDLVITLKRPNAHVPSCYLVIENKIKSMNSREQLERYTEDLDGLRLISGTFNGIRNTLESDIFMFPKQNNPYEFVQWVYVSYKEISGSIRTIAQSSQNFTIVNHLTQILEYCDIIDALNDVLDVNFARYENVLQYDCERDDLRSIHFLEVYRKLKGADFLRYVNSRREELQTLCPDGFYLDIHQDFNHDNVTLDFRITNQKKNCEDFLSIGIQIEGSQYRFVAVQNGTHKPQDIFKQFVGSWFDGNFIRGKAIHGHKTSQSKLYNQYKTNEYSFVYQYNNFDEHNLQYEQLFDEIKGDLAYIRSMVRK